MSSARRRRRCRRRPAPHGVAVRVGATVTARSSTAIVTGRPSPATPARRPARCCSHLSRWVAFGAASVTVSPRRRLDDVDAASTAAGRGPAASAGRSSHSPRRSPDAVAARVGPARAVGAGTAGAPRQRRRRPWRRRRPGGPGRRARCGRWPGRPAPAAGAGPVGGGLLELGDPGGQRADVVAGRRAAPSSAARARPRRAPGGRARGAARRASRRAARSPARAPPARAAGPARPARRPGAPSSCTSSGAISDRNPLRRWRTSASASARGSWPALTAWAIAVSAWPGSWSIIASTNSSNDSDVAGVAAGVGDQLERRQRVARRAGALGDGRVDGRVGDVEPGVGRRPSARARRARRPAAGGSAGAGCGCGSCR